MDHLSYALAWLSFGAGHSWLASQAPKRRLAPWLGRGYRLAYNAFAACHVVAVVAFGYWLFAAPARFANPFWPLALAGLAVVGFGLKDYDLGRLLGTFQLRHPDAPEDEPLSRDGLHRYVRHPLYAGSFLVLWGKAADEFELATAVWASLYLLIGAACEERRLLARYGQAYADYRRRVPAFVPWKGRAW
ncbi:MAG: isoprenylcysteine carboxylmethyltransferase family protein [Magnetospirillum sp. WYHS-4]